MSHQEEQPLSGGNVSAGVVRVGDTVRRPAGFWTPAVHALLSHLRDRGFTAAPRPLGIDDRGREVLSFARGEAVWPHRFDLLEPTARLARVGRLIRELHDAVADFTPPPGARWNALIPDIGHEIIAHHDLAPWNLVAQDGDAGRWTLIDWDNAAPGTRLWDLAYAAHGFLPLMAHPHWRLDDRRAAARLRALVDAYGLDESQRVALVPLLAVRARSMHDFLRDRHAAGVQPWATLWREGHGATWSADAAYVQRREELWRAALLSG